jgi:hypothetical protein
MALTWSNRSLKDEWVKILTRTSSLKRLARPESTFFKDLAIALSSSGRSALEFGAALPMDSMTLQAEPELPSLFLL